MDLYPRYGHLFRSCLRVVLRVPRLRYVFIESHLSQLVPYIRLIDDFMGFILEGHIQFRQAQNWLHELVLELFSSFLRFPLCPDLILNFLLERAPQGW